MLTIIERNLDMSKIFYNGEYFWDEKVPPVSVEVIVKAEKMLGIKFPEEYTSLLKESNGGTLCYYYVDKEGFDEYRMPEMAGIDFENPEEGIFSFCDDIKEYSLPESIVLLAWETYPHSCFALDYTHCTENPPVVYFYENYPEEGIVYSKTIVAPTFKEFLKSLFYRPLLRPSQLKISWKRANKTE